MMMTNAIVHEVIATNNRCIQNLHDGNIAHSLSALHVAMSTLKRHADAIDLGRGEVFFPLSEAQNDHHQYRESILTTYTVRIEIGPNATSKTTYRSSLVSQTPIARCHNYLLLSIVEKVDVTPSIGNHVKNAYGTASASDLHLICAALMYNMGILCHNYAYNCNSNGSCQSVSINTANLIRASKLYELLIELCNQSDMVLASNPRNDTHCLCSSFSLIRMIAYNNYAEICYAFGNYMKYKYCMNAILHQLGLPTCSNSSRNSIADSTIAIIYREIRLNVVIYKVCTAPTLAAAA